jgi:diguanylate cyclase (GGDEF)-like protein
VRPYGALMFLDLDNFKPINDTYGHSVGDVLLVEAAQRIKHCVRETDTVARFGGDEFVVLTHRTRCRSATAPNSTPMPWP